VNTIPHTERPPTPSLSPAPAAKRRTGIVKDEKYLNHCMGEDHPERPERLQTLYSMLEEPGMSGRLKEIPARSATQEELLLIHSPQYVRDLKATEGVAFTSLDSDTGTCALSNEAALLAAGGLCHAVALVSSGDLRNAFALIRPPGHHAEKSCAKGFCLYNNIAIAAKFAQKGLGIERVLIVDWDLHHGNGTQHSFEEDPSVLYFSVHQRHAFPGTGRFREAGKARGKGYTVNLPLPSGCGDGDYLLLFERILKPISREFAPQLVLVSAGFDIHAADPMGAMAVSTQGFAGLTRSVMDIADSNCDGKLVLSLEGGYELTALRDSVKAVLLELTGTTTTNTAKLLATADRRKIDRVLRKAWRIHRRHWPSLAASLDLHIRQRRSPLKWLSDLRDEAAAYMRS
jgi:acetoin utilization deacetylase AcuC-like enzyme